VKHPQAWIRRRTYFGLTTFLILVGVAWAARHTMNVLSAAHGRNHSAYLTVWVAVFAYLLWHLSLAWSERPFKTTPRQQKQIDGLWVTVNVPVYKEDPEALARALDALLHQTRMPQRIQVVVNGKGNPDYTEVREKWFADSRRRHPRLLAEWHEQQTPGKRHAQITTIVSDRGRADILATMDSDTILDHKCIEEGLKPFADRTIMSVASVILNYNHSAPLVRLTDTWFMAWQLTVRSALSRLRCVLVNSGNFAMYRMQPVVDNLALYGNETFAGRPVQFSDDSLLTLFAHMRGGTVQQPTSFAFTIQPEKVGHHLRQQMRWQRGSTIRSIWRFRYLPVRGWAYWENFVSWLNYVLATMAFFAVFVRHTASGASGGLYIVFFSLLTAYCVSAKYLTIGRSDQSVRSQLLTFAITPLMAVWTLFVLRPLRIYSILTCWKTGWGTRQNIEVTVGAGSTVSASVPMSAAIPAQRRDDDTMPLKQFRLLDPWTESTTEVEIGQGLRGGDS
jgi:hyaluronan synthase